jgi:hypothetical protein
MPLPSVVLLGAADYIIREKKRLDTPQSLGETDNPNCEILVLRKQAPASKRDTLLHETLHAILWLSGMSNEMDGDTEEKYVRYLTPWLLAFLRDNPEALAFLLEK